MLIAISWVSIPLAFTLGAHRHVRSVHCLLPISVNKRIINSNLQLFYFVRSLVITLENLFCLIVRNAPPSFPPASALLIHPSPPTTASDTHSSTGSQPQMKLRWCDTYLG